MLRLGVYTQITTQIKLQIPKQSMGTRAEAMLGKEIDDDFKIKLPKTTKEYEIEDIFYKNIFSLKK